MIADDGSPVLMDFGSAVKARVKIENRSQALFHQVRSPDVLQKPCRRPNASVEDIAAEQSTMAYRAPELFDVKTGTTLDEKVDIWARLVSLVPVLRSPDLAFAVV
jgi:serine/threonine kinase 16